MTCLRFTNPIETAEFLDIHGHEIPVLSEGEVDGVCNVLRERADTYFSHHENDLARLVELNHKWLDPGFEYREQALEIVPATSGFSRETIETFGFYPFTWDFSFSLPSGPMPELEPFEDGYMKSIGTHPASPRRPEFITRVLFGNVVGYDAITLLHGITSKVPQLVKVASGQPLFSFIYANSVEAMDPELRGTFFLAYWRGGDRQVEDAVFSRADLIDVWGSNETISDVQHRVAAMDNGPRVVENPHRIGMSFISRDYRDDPRVAGLLALDIACWSGMACFSTKNVFVEGELADVTAFGKRVAKSLQEQVKRFGTVQSPGLGPEMLHFAEGYETLELAGKDVVLLRPARGARWLVVIDGRPLAALQPTTSLAPMCAISAVPDLESATGFLAEQEDAWLFFEEASIAVPKDQLLPFSNKLIDMGFMNIKTLGSMAFPKQWEPHGGSFFNIPITNENDTFGATNTLKWVCVDTRDIDVELESNARRFHV